MSHIVRCRVEIKDEAALNQAIEHLGLTNLGNKTHKLYDGSYEGVGVTLPGWNYPIVINTETGQAQYDNYGGRWGKQVELDKLVQRYSMEVAITNAEMEGYSTTEMTAQEAFEAGLIDELPQDEETMYVEMVSMT